MNQETKTNFKKKWENYWYYYKPQTIIAIIFIVAAILFFVNMGGDENYDSEVILSYQGEVTKDTLNNFKKSLYEHTLDSTFDGFVGIHLIPVMSNPDAQLTEQEQLDKLKTEVANGKAIIYILDEKMYNALKADGNLEDLSVLYPHIPDVKGDRWFIKDTEFAKKFGINDVIPDDLAISVRKFVVTGDEKIDRSERLRYDYSYSAVQNIIEKKIIQEFPQD